MAVQTAGGAIVTSFILFHQPTFNKAGLKLVGLSALQGIATQVAVFVLSMKMADIASARASEADNKKNDVMVFAFFCTYTVCTLAIPVAAKLLSPHLGTPLEAFVNFACATALFATVWSYLASQRSNTDTHDE